MSENFEMDSEEERQWQEQFDQTHGDKNKGKEFGKRKNEQSSEYYNL